VSSKSWLILPFSGGCLSSIIMIVGFIFSVVFLFEEVKDPGNEMKTINKEISFIQSRIPAIEKGLLISKEDCTQKYKGTKYDSFTKTCIDIACRKVSVSTKDGKKKITFEEPLNEYSTSRLQRENRVIKKKGGQAYSCISTKSLNEIVDSKKRWNDDLNEEWYTGVLIVLAMLGLAFVMFFSSIWAFLLFWKRYKSR
jgi:hypothetical protein